MPTQLPKLNKHEPNPYRPDLPEDLRDLSSNLFDHMRESAETLREQHNVTQAGDTTFSWEILTEVDLEARYNVGSLGRFYHKQFGIIQARYCQFSKMRTTDWLGAPLGLIGDANPLNWVVTNDFSLSNPDSVIGLGGFYVLPPEGSYGWVIVNGVNIQSLGLRKRTPVLQGDKFVWSANDRVTTADSAEGKVLGKIVGEYDYQLIQNDDGTGDYALLTKADRTGTETFQRFQPLFWTCNFPSTMIASLTTDGETLIMDAEFTRENDLVGIIWESEDTWDHPLTAYDTNIDYSNCVLSFTIEITGSTLDLENVNGPVLTIEGKDGFGAPHTWYVRLVNYRTSGNATTAQIVLDFDNLAGGFAMDDPVNPAEIDRMFIGIVPASYSTDTPGPLPTKEICRIKLSNITTTGSNSVLVAGTGIGLNELRMTNGYDDTYNLTPERLVRNVWELGYRKWFNHYVGMSHYFSWEWNSGEGRFIARDVANPLNAPCTIWHNDLAKRLKALDFTVIFSISYEMLNSFIPAAWRQKDSDGLPALTGWEPPSSLFSPCNEVGMAYLNRVFVAFADILEANELPIHMQVGEPWWWIDFRDFKPYFYDSETTTKWTSETGLSVPIMTTMVGSKTPQEIQYLNWLGDRLAESTAAKIQAVRDKYPDVVSYVLVYLPQILSGFAGTPNTPEAKRVNMPTGWARPAFDVLQLEDYDFVINNEPHLSEAGRLLAEERLGYPRDEQQYFAGFVLFKDDEQIWQYTSYAIRQGWEFGVPEVFVWAYTQVMRDGYVNYLTSDSSFRQWEIPAGYAMVEPTADSEKRVKNWIDDKVSVATQAIPSLESAVKSLQGDEGLAGLTVRVQAAEETNENLATLISRESENRSRSLYVIDGRLTNLEQSLSGGVGAADFLNLQGVVNSLQGDFNSYIGYNNERVDQLQTQMSSVLAYGNLNEEIQSLRDADTGLADRITELTFLNLADVPDAYTGHANKVVQVLGTEIGVTFTTLTAGIIAFTPTGGLSSTDVQSALNELDTEKARLDGAAFSGTVTVPDLAYNQATWDSSAAVPTRNAIRDELETNVRPRLLPAGGASQYILQKSSASDYAVTWSALTAGIISYTPAGGISSTNVQSAINELDTEKARLDGAAFTGNITVPNDAYGVGWNGSQQVPTKDAIYDKIESMITTSLINDTGTYVEIKDGTGSVTGRLGGTVDPGNYWDNTTHYFRSRDGLTTFVSFSAGGFVSNVPITVPGDAYNATSWNGSTQVPTKDAIRDKIDAMDTTIAGKLTGSAITSANALIPTLNSPWINYGGGFGGARYYKDAAGIVHIEGLIQAPGGSPTSGVTLFTLLAGYRPPDTLMFVTWNGGGAGRIDVDSSGNVIMQSGNTAFTSLSGISFVPA